MKELDEGPIIIDGPLIPKLLRKHIDQQTVEHRRHSETSQTGIIQTNNEEEEEEDV